jgi:hypothetical protein
MDVSLLCQAFRASSFANASLNFLSSTIAAFGLSIEKQPEEFNLPNLKVVYFVLWQTASGYTRAARFRIG